MKSKNIVGLLQADLGKQSDVRMDRSTQFDEKERCSIIINIFKIIFILLLINCRSVLNKVAGYFSVDAHKDNVHPCDEVKIIPMLDITLANLLSIYQV